VARLTQGGLTGRWGAQEIRRQPPLRFQVTIDLTASTIEPEKRHYERIKAGASAAAGVVHTFPPPPVGCTRPRHPRTTTSSSDACPLCARCCLRDRKECLGRMSAYGRQAVVYARRLQSSPEDAAALVALLARAGGSGVSVELRSLRERRRHERLVAVPLFGDPTWPCAGSEHDRLPEQRAVVHAAEEGVSQTDHDEQGDAAPKSKRRKGVEQGMAAAAGPGDARLCTRAALLRILCAHEWVGAVVNDSIPLTTLSPSATGQYASQYRCPLPADMSGQVASIRWRGLLGYETRGGCGAKQVRGVWSME